MALKSLSPAVVTALLLTATAVVADEPAHNLGRYSMSPVEGGYLRLDTETGNVAMCAKTGEQWACTPVDDTAKARADSETSRLEAENRELKDRVRSLQDALEQGKPADGGTAPRAQVQVPSEQDIDQALDYMERVFKKVRERIRNLDKPLPPGGTTTPEKQGL